LTESLYCLVMNTVYEAHLLVLVSHTNHHLPVNSNILASLLFLNAVSVFSLPYIFIVLRVDTVYVQVCNVAHWRSCRTSAVVPAPLGPQEMELLAMTWMRSVHRCCQDDDDLLLFMFICVTAFTIKYCRNALISFTISVCLFMCTLRTVDWIFMKLDIKEFCWMCWHNLVLVKIRQ
jgi:hypothetical protein